MRHVTRLLPALVLVLALAACGGVTGYDIEEAQQVISDAAADAYPDAAPFEVTCDEPPGEAAAGATFSCTATDADGETYEFQVTGTDEEGNVDIQEL